MMGLCSGADMAHQTAVVDSRVRGLVMLDAWAYPNVGWYLHHYGRKMVRLSAWVRFVRVRLEKALGKHRKGPPPTGEGAEYELPRYVRVFPPKEKVERELQQFMDRDMRLFYVWTGGLWEYNHKSQHEETFSAVRFQQRIRVEHLKDANHILTGLHHQAWVTEQVGAWLEKQYPGRQDAQRRAGQAARAAESA